MFMRYYGANMLYNNDSYDNNISFSFENITTNGEPISIAPGINGNNVQMK